MLELIFKPRCEIPVMISVTPGVGKSYVTERRTIGEAEITLFAGLTGDYHPAHTDEIYAKSTKFGRRMAHGMLTISLSQGLITPTELRSSILALVGLGSVKFLSPVYPRDTIWLRFTIVSRRRSSSKPELCFMTVSNEVFKGTDGDNPEKVLEYKSTYLVLEELCQD